MTESQSRIYGYAYDWGTGEDLPASAQEEAIRQRAAEIDAEWVQCRIDSPVAGRTRPFHERPEGRKLLRQLAPDDWLIVWRIDALGDSLCEILEAHRLIGVRWVNIWILNHARDELKIPAEYIESLQKLLGPVAELEGQRISRRTRAAMRFRKEVGVAYTRRPPYGKKRFHSRMCDGRVLKADYWADRECCQIREITARHDGGESFDSIAADFSQRRERTAEGKLWVRKPLKGKRINASRIRRAYHYRKRLLAEGRDLDDLPVESASG